MNSETTELLGRSEAPEASLDRQQESAPERGDSVGREIGSATPTGVGTNAESSPGLAPVPRGGAAQAVGAGAPGLPGLPGAPDAAEETDEDDDFVLPDEFDYEQIVIDDRAKVSAATDDGGEPMRGTIVGKRSDGVFVDIGEKAEAFLPIQPNAMVPGKFEIGGTVEVMVTGSSPEGYKLLASLATQRPDSWQQLEAAHRTGQPVIGKVIGTVKGGLAVDVGVRGFMPASRSGELTEAGMHALVGQEIQALIRQCDQADRNVVLDRRALLEADRNKKREEVLQSLNVGDRMPGVVRTLKRFGAFVDLGGIDGLLHISDISWQRVNDPSDVLERGQEIEVEILKVDRAAGKVGVGLKQLQPEPWSVVAESIKVNERIRGKVVRIMEYGAFVEVLPGIEGLVHISDMSYARRVRHPSEIVSVGDVVEMLVLDVRPKQRRISLGLKQALGDPWQKIEDAYPVGSAATGTVRKITSFGAFVEILEGVDGLLHISDITSERRLTSPGEVLREGQQVRVKVLECDPGRRRLKVGMKQLEPTETEVFLSEVEVGQSVTGRVVTSDAGHAVIEVAPGVRGICVLQSGGTPEKGPALGQTSDLSSLKTMLESAWKGGREDSPEDQSGETLRAGSVHSFRITRVDASKGIIELAQA